MRRAIRAASLLLLFLWAGVGLRGTAIGETPAERMRPGHCPCNEGKAWWHYLRTPLRAPEDPCVCGLCAAKGDCSTKDRPEGWSAVCTGSQKPACFWKRHASSWGISCSACAIDEDCTSCGDLPGTPDEEGRKTLARQLLLEAGIGISKRTDPTTAAKGMVVAWTPRFYLATDIRQMKVITQGGAPRVMDTHEIAHLYLERAEKAYDDFVAAFGEDVRQGKPMAVLLASSNRKRDAWQAAYFGNPRTNMLYGGGDGRVAGGFCWNGFAASQDEEGDDRGMHGYVRHMIGHVLFSCWHGVSGLDKVCPKWAFVGVADWLAKIHPFFVDYTHFCHDEGTGANGSGKDWDKKARAIAAGGRGPIEKLFDVAGLSHLTYDDHVRSWSYMDTMLREDRERWLATLRLIREGRPHAVAFREGLGMTPDEFDKRWADRMAGRRKTMADVAKDAATADAEGGPNAAARRRIRAETDPETLAALLRGLESVGEVETADLVLSRLAIDSDLVRETIVMLLAKTTKPEVLDWLRTAGLADRDPLVRAHVARVLGVLGDGVSRPAFESMLGDAHWLVRANAARALELIADPASVPALVARVEDDNPKAWIAKADALAVFGAAASKATVPLASRLGDRDWQVRLTACRTLAKVGDADCVSPLIERLDTEGGRLHREILAALRAVTHETFSENPNTWRDWWRKQQPQGLPPAPPTEPDPRYAPTKPIRPEEPTYYGRRIFSQSVLFVIDLSRSMETWIEVPEAERARLGDLPAGLRIDVAKAAAKAAIAKLDARARFNIVFFSTVVKPWQKSLVVAGGMRESALSALQSAALQDETNVYGALRAALGLHERPTLAADLDPIPDTIYFMTDGTPTRGEITDTETILSWVREVNRFAKVELHVIAMGNTGVDLDFLRRLATENDGEFIHVPDRAK